MKRKFTSYPVDNFSDFKIKMLNWSKQFNIFCLLDNHQYNFSQPQFECLVAAGSIKVLQANSGNAFESLEDFTGNEKDWIFGHLSYDLKNEIEQISSENYDGVGFPDLFFFVPEIVLILKDNKVDIGTVDSDADVVFNMIHSVEAVKKTDNPVPVINKRFTESEYLETVKQIQQHILRGDCYEINFCQEFFAADCIIDPLDVYLKLGQLSPNPFAGFYKLGDKFLLCSSPERYLKKEGNKIYSQPIKGTSSRNLYNAQEDEHNKVQLSASEKEISENVMVVDLVRNDLSKVCLEGSVKVDELFGIYSFPQVHQMISTVSGTLDNNVDFSDILKATFPMGSMTGAPKKRVMELIEKYERTKRGLFSGALGYISPLGDFDFNVVIRSILYNASNKYVSMQAGSAITFYSEASKEYEECLLKMNAMKKVLE